MRIFEKNGKKYQKILGMIYVIFKSRGGQRFQIWLLEFKKNAFWISKTLKQSPKIAKKLLFDHVAKKPMRIFEKKGKKYQKNLDFHRNRQNFNYSSCLLFLLPKSVPKFFNSWQKIIYLFIFLLDEISNLRANSIKWNFLIFCLFLFQF